jgi:hypothetical protein
MNLRSIPRTAVGGYIKVLRWPLDRALGGNGKLAADRAEAAARDVAGTALGDDVLQADASARRAAADRRERAQTLEAAASRKSTEASERKRRADRERRERKQAAARAEQQRKQAADKAAGRAEAAIDEQAKRERLEQLDREAAAQADREDALTARDEARRLAEATAAVKAERKS